MFSPTVAIPAFLLLTFIYILSTFNHRKYARKRPPGPLALPIFGNIHLVGTLPHRNLQSLANKYGPIMSLRLGQVPTIVVSSPEAAELFLKTHDPIFADRPHNHASDYLFYGSKGGFSEYGSYWREMKKLSLQHLFGASNQELFGHLRREELKMVVNSLDNAAKMGEIVDVSEKLRELLEDIVYKMILGRNKDDQFDLKGLISETLRLAGAFNIADIVPWFEALDPQGLKQRCTKISRELDRLFEKIMKDHEEAPNTHKDGKHQDFVGVLVSFMHQSKDDEQNHETITRDDIKATILSMISGAYETSAVSVEWAMSELLRNPRVMKNLQNELETVIGMNRMVEETDLSKLSYLNLVVMENFRLNPVAPLIPRASAKDVTVGGYYIEKKSRILVNLWALGRSPQIWSDNADMFYPERFLNGNIDVQGHDFQLIPFGSGRRKCLGMQMGLTTVKLVLAQLVHCFDWELPFGMKPDELDMTESFGFTLPRSKHLSVVLTHRLSSMVYDEL
ncbi:hypothetical protein K1719_033805 [Acacia pycnantha]|nr:hypothetical protein K1719_033805 [Acacia pycnantha]